ncbi:PepSY-associated TM helix domain-containing protein [Paraburkholderia sp.]|uniref:PepSY-associated TM helix domain-containing protein n=1 Tax=Paraburkholderia sp. TaxID=1926495 RepID=UPI002386A530|nr:PepSY-associated TM helix domain-containing protein [Paraburkholderia sp.]MDE1182595.1 PepSY-associated TM helix domain-containing protein [Paraburkholderia sp.]
MLYIHRWISVVAGLVIIFICVTGLTMQSMDMFANVTHQPASNPTIQEFRQHLNGPDNYAVISDPDYTASVLPVGLDKYAALVRVAAAGRAAEPGQPMRLVELRMVGNRVAGQVKMGGKRLLYDALTGARLPDSQLPPADPNEISKGLRAETKNWHKFAFNQVLLQKASTVNLVAGTAVISLMVTGLIQYFRMLNRRQSAGKAQMFWSGGGFWRKFHRWTALVSVVLVIYLVTTGMLLAVSDIGAGIAEVYMPRNLGGGYWRNLHDTGDDAGRHRLVARPVHPDNGDYSSPIADADIQAMTTATTAAFERDQPGTPIKVFRLRYFAGYSQGVIVTGENPPLQHVYDTTNGRELSETEPGYPISNFPFGWQWHQTVKKFHRGDIFGLGGNVFEWLSGAALLYLASSGLWMYFSLWRRRAKSGKRQIVWR